MLSELLDKNSVAPLQQMASLHSLTLGQAGQAKRVISSFTQALPLGLRRTLHAIPTGTSNELQQPRPYSEIPKTKTILGLNVEMLQNPASVDKYMIQQIQKLGYIFRITGVPGMPEMLCVSSPRDVEAAYRVGDIEYPERFPFTEWKQARKELNRPLGLFLE